MTNDSSVLQEYLVRLGFQTNIASFKKFNDIITSSGGAVAQVGIKVAQTVAAVDAAVVAFAYSMRKMGFAAELANSSVKGMKEMAFAGEQVGISSEAMDSALHKLAENLRLNAGARAFVEGLTGIATEGRKTEDVLTDLVKSQENVPEYIGAQRLAQLTGMDADTFHMYRTHIKEIEANKKRLDAIYESMGVDPNAGAAMWKNIATSVDLAKLALEALAIKGFQVLGPFVAELNDNLESLVEWFGQMSTQTDGAMGTLRAFGNLIKTIVVPVVELLGITFKQVWKGWELIFTSMKPGFDYVTAFLNKVSSGWAMLAKVLGLGKTEPSLPAPSLPPSSGTGAKTSATVVSGAIKMPAAATNVSALGAINANSKSIAEGFMRMGWTKEQAEGIVANIKRESNFNPSAVGDSGRAYGIAQWHPDRQADFQARMGKNIRGSSLEEQMQFIHYELTQGKERKAGDALRKATTASQAGELMSRLYERPANAAGEANLRGMMATRLGTSKGGAGMQQTNNTTVNITANDVYSAKEQLVTGVSRINANQTRQFSNAAQ